MKRFYIFKDHSMIGSTCSKESAIDFIRQYQKQETHYLLKSEYSYIEGEEVFVPYEHPKRAPQKKHDKER